MDAIRRGCYGRLRLSTWSPYFPIIKVTPQVVGFKGHHPVADFDNQSQWVWIPANLLGLGCLLPDAESSELARQSRTDAVKEGVCIQKLRECLERVPAIEHVPERDAEATLKTT